ncbi:hypothetical protein [Blastopirellula retiformator]|uniref:Uncharacterized protein n=1 Tax=Blastopirellula retiformator TaxID=2527970 RepID=A0A5C5V5J3_9BACT|nr:hypothetical protein [Blastopirellula retiformator]TWT33005.1 hypothetical protein Enr8_28230 [Blastopirellula retiformator]
MVRWNRLFASLALCTLLAAPLCAEEENEIYGYPAVSKEWDDFTLNYPKGRWKLEKLEEQENQVSYKLTSKANPTISLSVSFTRGLASEDPQYDKNPNMTNIAVLLPAVQELTGGDDAKVIFSTGIVNLPAYSDTSARAAVLLEENVVLNMEACHFLLPKEENQSKLAIAIVFTSSKRGEIEESPEYPQIVAEAYAIIEGIEYPGLDDEEEEDDDQ